MTYTTRNLGLAAFLAYVLGTGGHIATHSSERGCTFEFTNDSGRCVELASSFFSDDGAPVTDARALLECLRDVRSTMFRARESGGEWKPDVQDV